MQAMVQALAVVLSSACALSLSSHCQLEEISAERETFGLR